MFKRMLKIVSVIVAAGVLLILVALLFLSSSPGENIIKTRIEKTVGEQTGLKISIGKLETNLFSRVQVNETAVLSSSPAVPDSLLYADKIKVTYSILDLLFGDTDLKSVTIDSVILNISVDSLGNYGIPVLDTAEKAVTEKEESSFSISVDSMVLSNVNATYSDKRIPIDICLYNLSTRINGQGNAEYLGSLSVDSISTRYEDQPVLTRNLNCDFSWDGTMLTLSSTAGIEGLDLNVGAALRLPQLDDLSLNALITGDPSGVLDIIRTGYDLPQIEMSNIAIDINARGSLESPEIDIEASSSRSRVENIDLDSFRLYAGYASGTVKLDTLIVESLGGRIQGSGLLSLQDTSSVDIDLRIEDVELAELWRPVYDEESPFTGIIRGSVRAKGRTDAFAGWNVKGNLNISRLFYLGHSADKMNIDFSVDNDIARLVLVHAEDTVQTRVVLKNGNIDGEFYANIPKISSISRFVDIPDLKGSIAAEGTFNGSLDNPAITIHLKGDGISYQNFPIDSVIGDLHYRDKSIIIDSLRLSGRRPEEAMFQSILGIDSLRGRFEYSCDVRGSTDFLEGGISAKIFSLGYSGYDIDSIFTSASVSGSKIRLDSLIINYPDLVVESSGSYDTVTSSGTLRTNIFSGSSNEEKIGRGAVLTDFSLPRHNNMRINVDCDSIWVGLLKYFTEIETPESGLLKMSLAFEGDAASPTGNMTAEAYSIKHPSYEIDSVLVTANLDGNHFYMDKFQLFAYGNSISASSGIYFERGPDGRLTLGENSAFYGELMADSIDLSILEPYAAPVGKLDGVSSADIAWDGTLKKPGVTGRIDIADGYLSLAERSTPLENIHLGLGLSDSLISIDSASFYSAGTPVSAKGMVKYDLKGNYDIRASMSVHDIGLLSAEGRIVKDNLDLRLFSDNFQLYIFTPFLALADSLGGELESEVLVKGTMAVPEITGFIKIADFSLHSSSLLLSIKSGLADLKFDRSRVDIDSLYADINGGSMNITGYVIHDAETLKDIDIKLKATNPLYQKSGEYKTTLQSAELTYNRKEDQYILDGDISFGESRLQARFPLKSILPWARSVETVEYEMPEMLAGTRLNLRVRENNDLWIDNNLANIRMKAEIGVIGTPARPIPTGFENIQEGYLIYLDNKFEVEKGEVFFSDPLKFNPEISLLAKTEVTEYQRTVAEKYTIYIKVEGDLENLRPDIYSEPPLDKTDIVSLLTLGSRRSRLTGNGENQGGIKNVLVERASRLTSTRVSGYISEKVTSIFGFDEFTVEGNLFAFDNSWGPRLVASRRISKKLELTYSTTVGHLNEQGVRVGYKLTPHISIQGETDQAGKSGIDVRYGLKFK